MTVIFPVLPFTQVGQPSIACSLLSQTLRLNGYESEVVYYNLFFSEEIGLKLYSKIASSFPGAEYLVGEILFSPALGNFQAVEYLHHLLARFRDEAFAEVIVFLEEVLRWQGRVIPYCDMVVEDLLARNPRIVGFSSSFQQHVVSLAVAKRIKQLRPDVFVMFGGANCEGDMGRQTVKSFSFVDAVVSGPADIIILRLVKAVYDGSPIESISGVFLQGCVSEETFGQIAEEPIMDQLPIPDYTDFFSQVTAFPGLTDVKFAIPMETSRGCWWGERNHCTFCGLNGASMKYRRKSPQRAYDEMKTLRSRHETGSFTFVDNILSLDYFDTLLRMLAHDRQMGSLFFEVKANLKRDKLNILKSAGVDQIQPGIESFSDDTLRGMNKGVSGLQNIRLLRDCKDIGIKPEWNLLYGFPREKESDYICQFELLPKISHLEPPISHGRVRIDRFSPLHSHARDCGIERLSAAEVYDYIYPNLLSDERQRIAYYFTAEYAERDMFKEERKLLAKIIESWKARHKFTCLGFSSINGHDVIIDSRAHPVKVIKITSVHKSLLCSLSDIVGVATALDKAEAELGKGIGANFIEICVGECWLIKSGNKIISVLEANLEPGKALGMAFVANDIHDGNLTNQANEFMITPLDMAQLLDSREASCG